MRYNKEMLKAEGLKRSVKLSKNVRFFEYENGDKFYKLHNTIIVKHITGGKIILNSGGWHTTTTKRKINEFINEGHTTNYYVYQSRFNWYIKDGEKVIEFFDGIEL